MQEQTSEGDNEPLLQSQNRQSNKMDFEDEEEKAFNNEDQADQPDLKDKDTTEMLHRDFMALLQRKKDQYDSFIQASDQLQENMRQECVTLSKIGINQIQQLQDILDNKQSTQSESIKISEEKFNIPQVKVENINTYMINLLFEDSEKRVFQPLLKLIQISRNIQNNVQQVVVQRDLKFTLSKFAKILEYLPLAAVVPKQNLFSQKKSANVWKVLHQKTIIKSLDSEENLIASYEKVMVGLRAFIATFHRLQETQSNLMKNLLFGFTPMYYIANEEERRSRSRDFIASSNMPQILQVWNMAEHGMFKRLVALGFQKIKYNQLIHIERKFLRITKDFILSEYQKGTINKITPMQVNNEPVTLASIENLLTHDVNKIQVRILCSEELQVYEGSENYSKNNLDHSTYRSLNNQGLISRFRRKNVKVFEKVIIHIHGGGFIAQTSFTHQSYTRQWANELDVPIFSIDYRLAPEYPFPAALDDCCGICKVLLQYKSNIKLDILPNQIVLVGDSAGGNLATALVNLCIKMNVRVPDGVMLAYPVLNLSYKIFSPSLLISLDDGLLPHTFLRQCFQAYLNQEGLQPDTDMLISPTEAPDEILKEYPRIRIMVGTNDPLHDESQQFALKFTNLEKDSIIIVYKGLPHGFISLAGSMVEAKETVQDARQIIQALLNDSSYSVQIEDQRKEKIT